MYRGGREFHKSSDWFLWPIVTIILKIYFLTVSPVILAYKLKLWKISWILSPWLGGLKNLKEVIFALWLTTLSETDEE